MAESVYTITDYLKGTSPILTGEGLKSILAKRNILPDTPTSELSQKELDLAEAEVYWWLLNQPVGGSSVKDVDGSWSHSEGGWQVSNENLRQWRTNYTDLRQKWGETVLTKSKIRIINL